MAKGAEAGENPWVAAGRAASEQLVQLGRQIRAAREATSLTPRQLSELTGLAPGYLIEIENGTKAASQESIDSIWRAMTAVSSGSAPELEGPRPRADLVERRNAIGLTQAEVAERAGISYMSLGKIESGWTRNPRKGTLNRIDQALDELTQERGGVERPTHPLKRDIDAAGLTVAEFAKHAGLSPATVHRIINGETAEPSDKTKAALVNGFEKADAARWAITDDQTTGAASGTSEEPGVASDPVAADVDVRASPGSAAELVREADPGFSPETRTPAVAEASGQAAEQTIAVPVQGKVVRVPAPPHTAELPQPPALPAHVEGLGRDAAYLHASMRGFAAGRQAGAAAAAEVEAPWDAPGSKGPSVGRDTEGQKLAKARARAAESDIGPDQDVGISWTRQEPPASPSAREVDELRARMASETPPSAREVHDRRHAQAAADGYRHGWVEKMTARALAEIAARRKGGSGGGAGPDPGGDGAGGPANRGGKGPGTPGKGGSGAAGSGSGGPDDAAVAGGTGARSNAEPASVGGDAASEQGGKAQEKPKAETRPAAEPAPRAGAPAAPRTETKAGDTGAGGDHKSSVGTGGSRADTKVGGGTRNGTATETKPAAEVAPKEANVKSGRQARGMAGGKTSTGGTPVPVQDGAARRQSNAAGTPGDGAAGGSTQADAGRRSGGPANEARAAPRSGAAPTQPRPVQQQVNHPPAPQRGQAARPHQGPRLQLRKAKGG